MSQMVSAPTWLAPAEALLDRLLAEHNPGHALQRGFQTEPAIYRLDLERIWRRGWLTVVMACSPHGGTFKARPAGAGWREQSEAGGGTGDHG